MVALTREKRWYYTTVALVGLLPFQKRDSKLTIGFLVDIPVDIMEMGYYLTLTV